MDSFRFIWQHSDHSSQARILKNDFPTPKLLFFKERFLAKDHPDRPKMDRFSAKLRKLGLREETIGLGPTNEPISYPNKADPSSIRNLASPWASARHLGMSQSQHPQTQTILLPYPADLAA